MGMDISIKTQDVDGNEVEVYNRGASYSFNDTLAASRCKIGDLRDLNMVPYSEATALVTEAFETLKREAFETPEPGAHEHDIIFLREFSAKLNKHPSGRLLIY